MANNVKSHWRIAFLASSHPGIQTFEALIKNNWIGLLIVPTSSDPANQTLIEIAKRHSIKIANDAKAIDEAEINLILASNYPKLIANSYLEKYPCLNTHWSALPKYRGIHGTAWSLINADYKVGCTLHWMSSHFDEGDILAQDFVTMLPDMSIIELHEELAKLQARLIVQILEEYTSAENFPRVKQDHTKATYVPQRYPEDGIIDWSWSTERLWNLVRVLEPARYPGAYTYLGDKKIIIWQASPAKTSNYYCTEGQVVRVIKNEGVWIKTGDGCLLVTKLQVEGEHDSPQLADKVLKRGDKLGYNPQLELAYLRERVSKLEQALELCIKK